MVFSDIYYVCSLDTSIGGVERLIMGYKRRGRGEDRLFYSEVPIKEGVEEKILGHSELHRWVILTNDIIYCILLS